MKRNTTFALAILLTMVSCDVRKSVYKDLNTGMVTRGDGLSVDEVYLSVGDETIERNTLTYGEELLVNFNGIEGFSLVEGYAFPGMSIWVTDQQGDTIFGTADAYADMQNGTNHDPLLLTANLTAADPIHSSGEYTLNIGIWDKESDGVFSAEMEFSVVPNEMIAVETEKVSYRELYLFSQQRNVVITDNRAKYEEDIHLILEGLDGFQTEDGMVSAGLSLVVVDSQGTTIISEDDLFGGSPIAREQLNNRLAPSFILTSHEIPGPVRFEFTLWDKNGDGKLTAKAELSIE